MVNRYARITLKNDRPNFSLKPFYLRVTNETDYRLSGIEVDRDGDEIVKNVGGVRVDETMHIIDKTCIAKQVPYKMSNMFAMLEKA